jgi:GT2 family glycosyltransferase
VSRRDVRLSALIVNYNSGAFALRCMESLEADWRRDGRRREDLRVIVVDNASPVDQEEWLGRLEERGATVLRHGCNGGYAEGMNVAFAESSGGPRDVVAILNPDLFFWPGCVTTCLDYLEQHDDCGAVSPKAYIDHGRVLQLPRNPLPTLVDHLRAAAAQASPALCRAYSRRRLRDALPWWRSDGPLETDMLSGCCLFLRREVVLELPSLMDARYPLYYEDTDLFRELTRRGYRLVSHGGATVLHHWSRSSGIGELFGGEPLRRYHVSQREYFRKFYGVLGLWTAGLVNRLFERWPEKYSFRPMHEIVPLGAFEEPVVIPLSRDTEFLLELTMAPTWLLAVGILGRGDRWVCPPETWEWFFQADYFMRAIDLETGEFLGAWSFQKSVPGRMEPLPLELAGFEPPPIEVPAASSSEEGAA